MIVVIIPFYQRQTGLLRQAVQSVMSQKTAIPWRIIVVDDGSPLPAQQDLDGLLHDCRLTVIRQSNRGASAARNRGLEQAPPGSDIIAFLDSDDVWEDGHLECIHTAMKSGADFYFANYGGRDEANPGLDDTIDWERFAKFEPARELYWFNGDCFDLHLKGSPARTSTVAYNFRRMPRLRFLESLWCGEDILFWMEASARARRIAMSRKIAAYFGRGVNISKHEWGSVSEVRHHLGASRYLQAVRSRFCLSAEQDSWSRKILNDLDMELWLSALAAGRRGGHDSLGLALSHIATRPQAVSRLPAALARAARARLSPIFTRSA